MLETDCRVVTAKPNKTAIGISRHQKDALTKENAPRMAPLAKVMMAGIIFRRRSRAELPLVGVP
ncbi:MAG: hypothetical protein WCA63_08325, partial [Gallionella sp.]